MYIALPTKGNLVQQIANLVLQIVSSADSPPDKREPRSADSKFGSTDSVLLDTRNLVDSTTSECHVNPH